MIQYRRRLRRHTAAPIFRSQALAEGSWVRSLSTELQQTCSIGSQIISELTKRLPGLVSWSFWESVWCQKTNSVRLGIVFGFSMSNLEIILRSKIEEISKFGFGVVVSQIVVLQIVVSQNVASQHFSNHKWLCRKLLCSHLHASHCHTTKSNPTLLTLSPLGHYTLTDPLALAVPSLWFVYAGTVTDGALREMLAKASKKRARLM